jgi:hypothetical protein
MAKIIKTRKQANGLILLVLALIGLLILLKCVRSFENDWYDSEYRYYQNHSAEYHTTNAVIVDQKVYNGSNDSSLTLINFYFTNIVEVTFENGQTKLFRTSRSMDEEIGQRISVAYDVRYDTEYDTMIEAEEVNAKDGAYLTIPRTISVENSFVSRILIAIIAALGIFTAGYVFRCYKKPEPFSY